MVTDRKITPGRWLTRGRLTRGVLIGMLLFPTYYLLFVMPHRGWIDFYQIFSGVQAIWRGEDPYLGLYYYPPWTALLLGPLMFLPYDPAAGQFQAAEAWFWINLAAVLGVALLWLPTVGVRIRSLNGTLLILAGLGFAPIQQSLIHGQSIPLLLLAVAVLGTRFGNHPLVAGLALATLTVKPQIGGLLLVGILLRSMRDRSFGVVASFAAVMSLLLAGSFLLRPTWPIDWLVKVPDGGLYAAGSPAIHFMLREAGVNPLIALAVALSIAAPAGLAYAWDAWKAEGTAPDPDFIAWGVTVSLLVTVYNHSYDYVLLLLPMALVAARLGTQPIHRRRMLQAALGVAYFIPLLRFFDVGPHSLVFCSGLIILVSLMVVRPAAASGAAEIIDMVHTV